MVSALDSRASAQGFSHVQEHCVVFLGKTLYSHGASLHPGVDVKWVAANLLCWTSIPSRREKIYSLHAKLG